MMQWIAISVLAAAMLAFALVTERRHRRQSRRVRAAEAAARRAQGELIMTRRELYAARALRTDVPGTPPVLRSQFGEDAFLLDLFAGQQTGFFVEAGAYDGLTLSTTSVLESLGWRGLLVEPLPDRFEQCSRNRPRSRVERFALGGPNASGTTTFEVAQGQGILDMASQRSVGEHQRKWVEGQQGTFRRIEVPLASLDSLLTPTLRDLSPSRGIVDLVVLDVEGAEAEALRGLDTARFGVRVFVIEDLTGGDDVIIPGMLRERGYVEAVRYGHNRVYLRLADHALIHRARALLAETDIAAPGFWEATAGVGA
jgi:FkbM family methyltransferase